MNEKCPYEILYEDNEIIVVYKKKDVLTIRTDDKKTYTHNLYHYLKLYLKKKSQELYIVHRLDYETSGIIIFAKNLEIKKKLQNAFTNHLVKRYYEAVINEHIKLNKNFNVKQYLLDHKGKVKITDKENGKEAITIIRSNNYINIGTVLDIEILTGRKNQIRLAISSLGFTLIGDKRYSNSFAKRMYLNAYKLIFPQNLNLKKSEFEVKPLWLVKQ